MVVLKLFQGLSQAAGLIWTPLIADRPVVLLLPWRCHTTEIKYNEYMNKIS